MKSTQTHTHTFGHKEHSISLLRKVIVVGLDPDTENAEMAMKCNELKFNLRVNVLQKIFVSCETFRDNCISIIFAHKLKTHLSFVKYSF